MIKHKREHRALLSIAIPMILSNITVPLLGLVDTAVIGHLPEAYYLGGTAVGTMIITVFLWLAGFLRMSTSGLSAQAYGAQSGQDMLLVLLRGLIVAFSLAFILVLFQVPIIKVGLFLSGGSAEVTFYARQYAEIRIWAFPASLANLVLLGWLLGMHKAKFVMWLLITTNLSNLILDIVFVQGFGWKVLGIAWATLIAEYIGLIMAIWFVIKIMNEQHIDYRAGLEKLFFWPQLAQYLALNRDILIRTLCLELCFVFITFQGARMGDTVVAANAILLNFLMLISFGLDGIAFGAEARVGQAKGAKDIVALKLSVRLALFWTFLFALIYSLFFLIFGESFIRAISTIEHVNQFAFQFLPWMVALPILACWCYLFDGVFIGLTKGKEMRNSMIIATFLGYFPLWYLLQGYGNHALWAAMSLFMVARGLTLGWVFVRMKPAELLS